MLIVTNIAAVNDAFAAKTPRPMRDVILEIYPDATIDSNGRAHAPHDGYICHLTDREFRAGEYLPMNEPDENYRVMGGSAHIPTAIDVNGKIHTWDGTRAQNIAVWGELVAQSKAADAGKSTYVGGIGSKISTSVTIAFVKAYNGAYGTVWIHVLKDASGNVIFYKGSKFLGKKDTTINLTATVKAHDVRDNVKQTVIERPKLVA